MFPRRRPTQLRQAFPPRRPVMPRTAHGAWVTAILAATPATSHPLLPRGWGANLVGTSLPSSARDSHPRDGSRPWNGPAGLRRVRAGIWRVAAGAFARRERIVQHCRPPECWDDGA